MELNTPKMRHEEMIDTLKGLVFGTFDRTTVKEREALDMAIEALEQEPRKGHWLKAQPRGIVSYSDAYAQCSCCDARVFSGRLMHYCPKCGARMEEGES